MAGIPKDVLDTWSNAGAQSSASDTYASIENALTTGSPSLEKQPYDYDIYLQGSYANSTNIYGNSDVDIIVKLDSTFSYDAPTDEEIRAINRAYPDATYSWQRFRSDVIDILEDYYGSFYVKPGNKAIKVETPGGKAPALDADVVACQQYREYSHFRSRSDHSKAEGIIFWTQDSGRKVINYPKKHRENGQDKNQNTDEEYKPTVRIFKNARERIVENRPMDRGTAPSFFIECLLSNIPNMYFNNSYQERLQAIVDYINRSDISSFTTQSGELPLFSESNKDVWNIDEANTYIQEIIRLWNHWEEY